MTQLTDRVAWITGGGWNLGRGVAEAFARAGAKVALSGRDAGRLEEVATELRAAGAEALAVPLDATRADEVERGATTIRETLGPIEILAAFAGGGCVTGSLDEIDGDTWWRIVESNLRTAQLTTRAALPDLRACGRGVLLFCVGAGSFFPEVGSPISAYAAANAALCRLTDQLAVDEMEAGVRVNALEPGDAGSPGDSRNPGAVERAAELALWLASDASAPLTGRSVSVADEWWRDPSEVQRVAASHHLACLRRVAP